MKFHRFHAKKVVKNPVNQRKVKCWIGDPKPKQFG